MKRLIIALAAAFLTLLCLTASADRIISLDDFGYDASDWFSSAGNRAYAAAAVYGEAPESAFGGIGMPTQVLMAKSVMDDNSTEFLILDYLCSDGKYYMVTFYPKGTPVDQYAHALYTGADPIPGGFVKYSYAGSYAAISFTDFSAAYSAWEENGKTEPQETPQHDYSFSYTWRTAQQDKKTTFYFEMPARGYIDLTLTKKVSSSADSYGYYYLKIYGNGKYCLDTRTLSTRDRSEDLFTVGLDQGSYLITLEQKGMYTNYFPVTASLTLDITEDDFFETEENNTKASATPIATNAMYNAIFGEEYECVDWYSFNVLAGEKYRIRMKNIGKLGSTTALFSLSDSSGKETSFGYTLKKQETEDYNFYDFSPAQSGTYSVKIYNYHRKDALIPYQIGVYREIDLDSLNTLEFPESLLVIEDEAFAGGTFEAAIIPDGCISIGSRAFADCPNLVFVHIPKTVKAIAGDAFDGCGDVIIDR